MNLLFIIKGNNNKYYISNYEREEIINESVKIYI